MAKKKSSEPTKPGQPKKPMTKSQYLERALGRNAGAELVDINRQWTRDGYEGQISEPLYYQVRRRLGIKSVWTWGPAETPESLKAQKAEKAKIEIYQLKITLHYIKPQIWRRIQVPDCSLETLHQLIQKAMGWTNSHMHEFQVGKKRYRRPHPANLDFGDEEFENSETTRLSDILPKDSKRFAFTYEYDFGDGWTHILEFERRRKPDLDTEYPICVEGERACPPEDCGGFPGYEQLLEILADPSHPEHDETVDWVGPKFKPEAFNPALASLDMKDVFAD